MSAYVNLNSEESRAFISNFKRNVEPIFRAQLSNFKRVDVKKLSSGSVVVDFDIVVQKSSNATQDNVVGVLIEANSTGSLGYRLTGEITVEELRNLTSTNTAGKYRVLLTNTDKPSASPALLQTCHTIIRGTKCFHFCSP